MTALSLAMLEVEGMNLEDFYHVRAYHCRNQQQIQRAIELQSPTSSDSSGISCTMSNLTSDDDNNQMTKDNILSTATKTNLTLRTEFLKPEPGNIPPENVERKKRIMYRGRDILNLGRNLQQHEWQLSSPLLGCLNPYRYVEFRHDLRFVGDTFEQFPLIKCKDCDYHVPPQCQ